MTLIELYESLGFVLLPIADRRKFPTYQGWDETKFRQYRPTENVGVLLGPSNIVDIDLDCSEASQLAWSFLPETASFGRAGKPLSHLIYQGNTSSHKYTNSQRECILEIRSDGCQTLFPPSVHPSGETIEWISLDNIAPFPGRSVIDRLAAATLLVQLSPELGSRHDFAMALGGMLAAASWNVSQIEAFCRPVFDVAQFNDTDRHIATAINAVARRESGELNRGAGALSDLIGRKNVAQIRRLLNIDQETGRERVSVIAPLSAQVDACIRAIARTDVYQMQGSLVGIVHEAVESDGSVKASGQPTIKEITPTNLHERLTDLVQFVGEDADGNVKFLKLPISIPQYIIDRKQWDHIRPIDFVVGYPYLARDGSIITEPGVRDRVFSSNTYSIDVPKSPTRDDALSALSVILEPFCDVPFAADIDKAAAVSFLLTLISRPSIDGSVPLFLVDGNSPGTGKTTLVTSLAYLATGEVLPASMLSKQDEEFRKALISYTIAGKPIVFFDNVRGLINLPSLEAAITSSRINDRLLGSSAIVDLPFRSTVVISANQSTARPDLLRRSVICRLNTLEKNPASRDDFRYGRGAMLPMCIEFRRELLVAAFTILRAYRLSGEEIATEPFGSFEEWRRAIAAPLVWLGLPAPHARSEAELDDYSDETATADDPLLQLFAHMTDRQWRTSEMLSEPKLQVILHDIFPRPQTPTTRALGCLLRSHRDRVIEIDGERHRLVRRTRDGYSLWTVEKVTKTVDRLADSA